MKRKYKRNFITSVILRIDFDKTSEIDFEKFSFVKDNYPVEKTQRKIDFITTLSKGKQSIEQIEYEEYRYYDNSMDNCISISESSIFFELKKHISFEDLKKQFIEIFDFLRKEYMIENWNRLGLRYVNNIDISAQEYKEYLVPEILSNNKHIKNINDRLDTKYGTILSLGHIALKNKHSVINFIFGNQNKHYPAVIVAQDFVLDFDSYSTDIDKDNIIVTIDMLHDNIVELFENSITDNFRSLMNHE